MPKKFVWNLYTDPMVFDSKASFYIFQHFFRVIMGWAFLSGEVGGGIILLDNKRVAPAVLLAGGPNERNSNDILRRVSDQI